VSEYDLLQTGRRIRHLISSAVAALVACGVLAPFLWEVIDPPSGLTSGPWFAFIFFLIGTGVVVLLLTNYLLRRRADREWYEPAKATLKDDRKP
jgi:cytochrome c biogenesis factor